MDAPREKSPGIRQLDIAAPASGGPALRITILNGSIDPFPMPGDNPRIPQDPSRSPAFRGADETWAFLTGADPVDTLFGEDDVDSAYLVGDDLDAAYELEGDVVRAARPRSGP